MAVTSWLVDASALVRLGRSRDADTWSTRVERGLVRVSTGTLLEVGWSARSGRDLRAARSRAPVRQMPLEAVTPAAEARAAEVQALLADRGQHRGPSPVDLLVAAIAEQSGLHVLHHDRDYELIAEVTGQPLERLVLADVTPS